MPKVESVYESSLLERIRARYEGRDGPDGKPWLPEEGQRLVVEQIARDFGVHSNSVFHWARIFGWRRPAWYRQHRPKRPNANKAVGPVRVRLLAILAEAARRGGPVASNRQLAPVLACSSSGVVHALRVLLQRREIASEQKGPLRRFAVDGEWTAWSASPRDPRPAIRPTLEARRHNLCTAGLSAREEAARKRDDRVLAVLRRLAAAGEAFPSDVEIARLVRMPEGSVKNVLGRLCDRGDIAIERRPNRRRADFPDGAALGWSLGRDRRPAVDLAAADAVRALRRMGRHVFDVAVVTGRAWGVSWSVDGRIMGRGALIAHAGERRSAALAQMVGG